MPDAKSSVQRHGCTHRSKYWLCGLPDANSHPMNMLAFDTHAAVKRLTAHGLTEEQAESIVSVIGESAAHRLANLATTDELDRGLEKTENKLDAKIELVAANLRGEIIASQNKIIVWLAGVMIALSGLTIAAFKLF